MFKQKNTRTPLGAAAAMAAVIYHSVVRDVRKKHRNAVMAIALNMLQIVLFVVAFYVMFSLLGLRGVALRGDFLVFIMTGIFLFQSHTKTLSAVAGSDGPASPMMQHAPMNTTVSILSAAFGALYVQTLSLLLILFGYHVAFKPLEIADPVSCFAMFLIAWFTGAGLGLVLLAVKPWAPVLVSIFSTIYQRANMIASGKMFVANTLPGFMLAMFDWNPLFHAIDQARGFAFVNYFPRYSSWEYALGVGGVLVAIGLIGEYYTRKHASMSWSALG
ncbi:MAG: ABC transporter permease [Marinibacterium sp.]|nr:ABC transporter permease [Marinibacterium sp.]